MAVKEANLKTKVSYISEVDINQIGSTRDVVDAVVGEAWLLHLSRTLCVAIGRYELKYLETDYELIQVPGAPGYCNTCINWQGQLIPVLDALQLLHDPGAIAVQPGVAEVAVSGLAIVAFEQGTKGDREGMALGALAVAQPPILNPIYAHQACDLDDLPYWLQRHSRACFLYDEHPVACLSLNQLFSPFETV